MFGSWTFGRKLGAGFVLACLALIVVGAVGYRSAERLIENDQWVEHTQKVRRGISDLLATVVDAETGQRGYVITGDDAFLEPYRAAVAKVDSVYGDLRTLTSDNASQLHRLDELRTLIDTKLAELKEVIDARRAGGFDAAAKIIAGHAGQQAMDRARAVIAAMDDDERALLGERAEAASATADMTKQVILWGSLAALLLVALIGWTITRSLTAQVGAAVRHMQSSSSELQAAATQQATGAREQSSAMSEISTTISELLATSRQIAESAQRVSSIAEQTATSARTGDATVGRGNDTIQAIRRQVDLVVTSMLELGKKSQQVGVVLDIVAELAEQTNILAINATIEAAGAGETGRRFAVVADEIRKLADRVAGSTKEIRGLVDDVRSAVNTTVMTTETSSKAVDAGSRQFSEVATAFEQIVGRVSTATDAAKEIELSTKQQATAVEQVTLAITNVAQATRETEASTGQTLQTASELATLSRDLMKLVQPQVRA